ncbi:unnamed protein product [Orchesella dallaii]|uniref:Uncharacterized protein n=1 Tax=Orchesella dallaii TaxID=48710 RepID=A0ABP1RWE8_9HEXA
MEMIATSERVDPQQPTCKNFVSTCVISLVDPGITSSTSACTGGDPTVVIISSSDDMKGKESLPNDISVEETKANKALTTRRSHYCLVCNNNSENSQETQSASTPSTNRIKLIQKFGQLQKSTPNQNNIFLTLPHGKYPFPVLEEQQVKTVKNFVEKWIFSHNLVNETHPISLRLEEYPIKHAFYLAPIFPKNPVGLKLKTFLKFASCWWIMDDFFWRSASADQTPFLHSGFFKDLKKIVTNVITGLYRHPDAVPYFEIPLFHHCLKALLEVQEDLRECVGNTSYDKHYKYLLREMLEWIEGYKIFIHTNVGSSLESCDWTFLSCRRFNGRSCLLEVIQMLDGAFIGDSIRDQKLFKMFYETGIFIHNLSTDLFSAEKDVEADFNMGSLLVRHQQHEKQRSQKERCAHESFQVVLNEFNRAVIDFQRISKGLLNEISQHEQLERFVNNCHNFIDGGIKVLLEEAKCCDNYLFEANN